MKIFKENKKNFGGSYILFLKIGEINVTNYSRIEKAFEIYQDLMI